MLQRELELETKQGWQSCQKKEHATAEATRPCLTKEALLLLTLHGEESTALWGGPWATNTMVMGSWQGPGYVQQSGACAGPAPRHTAQLQDHPDPN